MRRLLFAILLAAGLFFCNNASAQLNKDYFYYMGRGFINESMYEDAVVTLNIILRTDPEAYEAYFLRGVAKYNLDDLYGADQDFSAAVALNPVYTLAFHYRAITRSRLGNYDDALNDFKEAIALRPDQEGTYFSRGITYYMTGQYEKAIADFDEFIKRNDKVQDAYINRGTSYINLGDTLRAMEDYNAAVRVNREGPKGYNRRGTLYLAQKEYELALADFNEAIKRDSSYIHAHINRAITHANTQKPIDALADFDKVIELDPRNSLTYFNRALIRSQIGDYNRALDDYNRVAELSPNNVLVYFNRAGINTQLGLLESAIADYSKAIELYPDFANAYINRSNIKGYLGDTRGARLDRNLADAKIAEYRSKLNDSTFSIYADTSQTFNQLLAFDAKFDSGGEIGETEVVAMLPLFKFSLRYPETEKGVALLPVYYNEKVEEFRRDIDREHLVLTINESNISTDSLLMIDRDMERRVMANGSDWKALFERGITQGLIKQYTNSVNTYSEAIEKYPANPFLYLNRSTTRSEMIDFISSIDNSYQSITIDGTLSGQSNNISTRRYNYDEAIADLNKAIKLMPDFAHLYYNRANLLALSDRMPEAYDDYSKAIELYPSFAEAYFNRGLVQIYMKDTQKGALDVSKAGELGIKEAYTVLKRYAYDDEY